MSCEACISLVLSKYVMQTVWVAQCNPDGRCRRTEIIEKL